MTRKLILTIMQVQTAFRQSIQRELKSHKVDLTFEMLQILVFLWRKNGVNQQELAASTFKDKASLTSILHNLEAKDLIKRVENQTDRRNKNVFLTDKGVKYGETIRPILNEIYKSAEDKLNKSEVKQCIEFLQELKDVFKE